MKVIDYKTGSKSFDVTALYHGLQLQLMVYMDAALQLEQKKHPQKEILPAGVFYYRIQDPLIDRPKEGEEKETILKELKPDGMISLEKEVLEHLDHCMVGESSVIPVKYNKNGSLEELKSGVCTGLLSYDEVCGQYGGRDQAENPVR